MNQSTPRLEAFHVPPYKGGERRNTELPSGTEQRNASGTQGLRALADKALSRIRNGTAAEQKAEHASKIGVPPTPSSVPLFSPCPPVDDPVVAEWLAENPKLVCARCWWERQRQWREEDGATTRHPRRGRASRNGLQRGTS